MFSLEKKAEEILEKADIKLNGNRPWDIKVKDKRAYEETFSKGTLGFGESYMKGWIEIDDLEEFFTRIFENKIDEEINSPKILPYVMKSFIKTKFSKEDPFEV